MSYTMLGFYFVLVLFSSRQLTDAASTKVDAKTDTKTATPLDSKPDKVKYTPIVFPGPTSDLTSRYGDEDKDIPDECKNLTYCSIKPDDYPQEYFDNLYKGTKATAPVLILTDNRQGDPDERNDCESEISYEPLYKVRSKRGWHTVAQAPKENYVQMVRLEKCAGEQKQCFTQFSIPTDLTTFCKQTYSVWEFVVLKEDETGTEKVQVELPICCSCYYKSIS